MQELSTLQTKTKEKVELYFSCRNLKCKDLGSLSDPFVVLFTVDAKKFKREVFRTKIKWNTHSPDFAETFETDFIFEQRQIFVVEVRDADDKTGTQFDSLGSVVCDP